jgi:chromosome partitioning protein
MDLLPANLRLARAEPELMSEHMREMRLRQVVEPLRSQYDFILLDCPPSLGLLSTLSLIASDSVLVPIETEYKALKGTDILLETIGEMRQAKKLFNETLEIEGFLPTKFDGRKNQHLTILRSIIMQLANDGPVFLQVPDRAELPNSNQAHEPLKIFSSRCDALISFMLVAHHMAGVELPGKTVLKLNTWAKTGKIIPELIVGEMQPEMLDNMVLPAGVTDTLQTYAREVSHGATA